MTAQIPDDIRPVVGYEDRYSVSRSGAVLNSRTGGTRKLYKKPDDYIVTQLWRGNKAKAARVHRLVWEAFRGPIPTGKEINHADGDKSNNNLGNLECVTRSRNMQHAMDHGMYPIGEKHPYAKLTEAQVAEVRERRRRGESVQGIAKSCGINWHSVHGIVYGRTWRRVSGGPEASVVRVVGA